MHELLSPELDQETIPTVGIIVFHEKSVLLVKHTQSSKHVEGIYGLPAGRIENGETEQEAAQRELREETGLTVELTDLMHDPSKVYISNIQRNNGQTKRFSMLTFIAEKVTGELVASDETIPEWTQLNKLEGLYLLPDVQTAISDALRFISDIKIRKI